MSQSAARNASAQMASETPGTPEICAPSSLSAFERPSTDADSAGVKSNMLQTECNKTNDQMDGSRKKIHRIVTVMGVCLLLMSIVIIIVMFSLSSKVNEQVRGRLANTYGYNDPAENATANS